MSDEEARHMKGVSGYVLSIGDEVEYRSNFRDRADGFVTGIVTAFVDKDGNPVEKDAPIAVITPGHTVLRDEHPHGLRVGSAHWGTAVVLLPE
jgi:hypothetical protein